MAVRHFAYRAKRADVIIFLDIPLLHCLYRIFKRAITCFGKAKKSRPKGCPERLPSIEFLSYVLNFNKTRRPIIEELLQKYKNQKKVFIIKNSNELEKLIRHFSLKKL